LRSELAGYRLIGIGYRVVHGGLAIQNASLYLKLQENKKDLEADIWSHRSCF
jgi:hypothetical protein